jgi:hypothetical protein
MTARNADANAALRIEAVVNAKSRKDWLRVPHRVYAGDPAWVAPLHFVENQRITPKHNPFFSFAEVQLFVAYRGDEPVGRISAQVNRRYLELYKDATGHFGFFDCIDDDEATAALVAAAGDWLKARGMARIEGPFNFSINQECGLLISGFDTPPAIMMTHARPWMGPALEKTGLTKSMEMHAYRFNPAVMPDRLQRLAKMARSSADVSIREIDTSKFHEEVQTLIDIFNDAWRDNWGFVSFSDAEIEAMIGEMKLFFRSNYGRFVLYKGKPAGVMVALPNINEIAADFDGKLLPFNWAKLFWSLWRETAQTARVPLMGLRKEFQSSPIAAGMLALLVSEFVGESKDYPLQWIEFSWVLDVNRPMKALSELAAGPPVKTYRIYGKLLD